MIFHDFAFLLYDCVPAFETLARTGVQPRIVYRNRFSKTPLTELQEQIVEAMKHGKSINHKREEGLRRRIEVLFLFDDPNEAMRFKLALP
jgi:hypothetical protein